MSDPPRSSPGRRDDRSGSSARPTPVPSAWPGVLYLLIGLFFAYQVVTDNPGPPLVYLYLLLAVTNPLLGVGRLLAVSRARAGAPQRPGA